MHDFQLLVKGKIKKYNRWEDIPEKFDHLIKFLPEIPPEPHTQEDHDVIHEWENRFKQLISINTLVNLVISLLISTFLSGT